MFADTAFPSMVRVIAVTPLPEPFSRSLRYCGSLPNWCQFVPSHRNAATSPYSSDKIPSDAGRPASVTAGRLMFAMITGTADANVGVGVGNVTVTGPVNMIRVPMSVATSV